MTTRHAIAATGVVIVLTTLGVVSADRWPTPTSATTPTARVTRGSLTLDVHLTGEVRARRSVPMVAPRAGASLYLVRLVDTGTAVRAGDVVMEFDPSEQAHALEQSQSELEEAEQEIIKLEADTAVKQAEDDLALVTAQFDVRRAELEAVADLNLFSANEVKRRALALEEAGQRLAELEGALSSRAATNRAALAVLAERRTQARLASQRAEQVIDSLVVRAPLDGVVVVRENRDGVQIFFSGMTLPEYRVGDTTRSGRIVAEVVESSQLQVVARVGENESPNLSQGQSATVAVDGLADSPLPATIEAVGGTVSSDAFFGASGPTREFDVFLQLDDVDPRVRPGMSVHAVAGRELPDVLKLPRQAVFDREGNTVVYVDESGVFRETPVTVIGSSEGVVAIEGIAEGVDVALLDPTVDAPASRSGQSGPLSPAGVAP